MTLSTIFLIIALILFAVAAVAALAAFGAFGAGPPRISLTPLGLAFLAAAMLVPMV
jgi:ABC-type proline/glycine betaine transport system permease subunit